MGRLRVRQLDQHVGMTGISYLAGAGKILALKLARIEAFFQQVVAVEHQCRKLPATLVEGPGDIGFGTNECLHIRPLDRVSPFRARAHIDDVRVLWRLVSVARASAAAKVQT